MKSFLVIVFCSFLSVHCFSQSTEVQNTVKAAFDALAELNIPKMKSYFTKDLQIIEGGLVWNTDSLVQRLIAALPDTSFKRKNHFDFIETKVDGNTAWTWYYQEATGISRGRPFRVKWIESAILNKEEGQWKMRFLHSTPLERK